MSSAYYFRKWKNVIKNLDTIINLDLEYQDTKAHDQQWCDAVERLSGMLGTYIASYNDAVECLHQNLQIQKTLYMSNIVDAIVARILELKEQLRKLEGSCYQFLGNSLFDHKLTSYDVEFSQLSNQYKRSEDIETAVSEALQKAKNKSEETIVNIDNERPSENLTEKLKWWDAGETLPEEDHQGINITKIYEVAEKISEESLERKKMIALIQAHEKTRQVTKLFTQRKQRRELWEKELKGILNPPAKRVLRERSAKIIQIVMRSYFKIKRERLKLYKREELLQMRFCERPKKEYIQRDKEIKLRNFETYQRYKEEWERDCEEYMKDFKKRRGDEIGEEFRDCIRNWFEKWYYEAKFFYDIPKENQGGTLLIIKEEIPTPSEWLQKYEAYLEEKKANKNKTALQLKYEKLAAKEEEMMLKREELKKKKLEAELLKKIMKNPTLHPGYNYPLSKKIKHLCESLEKYNKDWSDLDSEENIDVKEKYVKIITKIICVWSLKQKYALNQDLTDEIKTLKKALAEEYKNNEEIMPSKIPEKKHRTKKTRQIKKQTADISDKLLDLAENNVLKEYPKTIFADFLGDFNYAGDDMRCSLRSPLPFGGETRTIWWERCREVMHGFRKVLLVGPRDSGKTTLVHIMATECDAVLYELDPLQIAVENQTSEHLKQLINDTAACAKVTQPSVIHMKNINLLFSSKVPPEYSYMKMDLIKRYFIRQLFKKIHKHDNITIVGSCVNPWMTRSKQMLKKFKSVVLLPDTNYSTVQLILRNWVLNNRIIPLNLDTHSLAYVLRGYPFGMLITALEEFLTAERIIKIACFGLKSTEVYNYIVESYSNVESDYDKYKNWYINNTYWGIMESKHLEERLQFKARLGEWNEKTKKKKQRNKAK
nr:IQ and AAA domain-containing protein 1-like [Danaus plexippus plexippus]